MVTEPVTCPDRAGRGGRGERGIETEREQERHTWRGKDLFQLPAHSQCLPAARTPARFPKQVQGPRPGHCGCCIPGVPAGKGGQESSRALPARRADPTHTVHVLPQMSCLLGQTVARSWEVNEGLGQCRQHHVVSTPGTDEGPLWATHDRPACGYREGPCLPRGQAWADIWEMPIPHP